MHKRKSVAVTPSMQLADYLVNQLLHLKMDNITFEDKCYYLALWPQTLNKVKKLPNRLIV